MKITQGSIIIVPFPFSNQSGKKIRPALVVSSSKFNEASADVWITGISTKSDSRLLKIPLNQEDLNEGTLRLNSFVKVSSIVHIQQNLLGKKVGQIKKEKLKEVIEEMRKILQLN